VEWDTGCKEAMERGRALGCHSFPETNTLSFSFPGLNNDYNEQMGMMDIENGCASARKSNAVGAKAYVGIVRQFSHHLPNMSVVFNG
jgi:hypothetical protein